MWESVLSRAWLRRPNPRGVVQISLLKGVLIFALSVFSPQLAADAPESRAISAGETHHQPLSTDHPFSYVFMAEANKSYLVEINQGGLDLKVTVTTPEGAATTFNSPLLRDESELVLLEPGTAGQFGITLLSTEYSGVTANTAIRIEEVFPTTDTGRERLAGLRLVSRASAANHLGTMEGWESALEFYQRATGHFGNAHDKANLARTLFSIATIEYWQMMKWDRCAELAARAAEIYRQEGKQQLAANAVHLQAAATIEKANEVEKSIAGGLASEASELFDTAFELFNQALDEQKKLGHLFDAALITNNIGLTNYYLGEWDDAAVHFREAAVQFKQLNEWGFELQSLSNVNVIDVEHGNLVRGIETTRRILELIPEGKRKRFEADQLDNLGASLLTFGQLDEALQRFSRALVIHEQIEDVKGQGRSLAGIGTTYYAIGELELALQILETALAARQKANDGRGQVAVLKFIGDIHRQNGNYSKAMQAHSAALRLVTAPIEKARARIQLARDFVAAGDPGKARETLHEASDDGRDVNNRRLLAEMSQVSADAWFLAGEYGQSATAFRVAAEAYHALGLAAERSQAIFGQARTARMLGEPDQAVEYAELAIATVETLRQQLIAPELRKFFLASKQQYYAFLVDTLMTMHQESADTANGYLRRALSVSERSRARALVDLVSEGAINPETAANSEAIEQQGLLYQQMAENRYRLNKLLDLPDEPGSTQAIAALRQALAGIENQLNLLQIEIRNQNSAYAHLVDPQILDAGQMQDLLDSDSVLLQYFLGEEKSYAWSVTRDAIEGWPLPARGAIEENARSLYAQLKTPAFSAQSRAELEASIAALSAKLIGPLGALDKKRIIVAADGVLHYLPFSVLHGPGQAADQEPLLADHEFVYLPSMSVLVAQHGGRREQAAPKKKMAIFADPVFASSDSRFSATPMPAGASGTNRVQRAWVSGDPAGLTRLPATSFEARAIAELVEPGELLLAIGFDASRAAVLAADLGDYQIVHFATHGLIDSRYPALSALALSRFDKRGEPQDGFLRLHDFYNLELNADLVTMSACSTALGREISGEGLTGLTQGLMYSGSRSVLASLWQVPDRATAELMKRFYQNLLNNHQKPAEALRNAQLELSSTARWRSPYFWSAFVLQGDWQ